jgi:hypothetical protein
MTVRALCIGIFGSVMAMGCGFSPSSAGEAVMEGTGGSSGNLGGNSGVGSSQGTAGTGSISGGGNSHGSGDIGTGGSAMPPTVDANCGQVNNPLKVVPPDVLIIQDKSGSMKNDDSDSSCKNGCGANSKWSQTTTALGQVVMNTQATVNWGLKFFADGADQCAVNPGVAVPVAANNASAISTAISKASPSSATPTRAAINASVTYMQTLTDTNPKYLLVATDGEPNCPSGCSGTTCTNTPNVSEEMGTEQAVLDAVAAGFKVFVVGIGNVSSAVATLNQMAINGGEAQSGATSYYAATDQAALEAALNAIVGKVASCQLNLPAKPQDPTNVVVEDVPTKTQIPKDTSHANGWDFTDSTDTAIQLFGDACNNVTNGVYTDIQILEGCPGITIILN